MRNYISLKEFCTDECLEKLQYFDEEFLVILQNDRPIYLGFPNILSQEIKKEFALKSENISVENITNLKEKAKNRGVLHILKGRKQYYNLIEYNIKYDFYICDKLVEKGRNELLETIGEYENKKTSLNTGKKGK